jgi:hypothetical protein
MFLIVTNRVTWGKLIFTTVAEGEPGIAKEDVVKGIELA